MGDWRWLMLVVGFTYAHAVLAL